MAEISIYDKVHAATAQLERFNAVTEIGLILGTGLQSLLDKCQIIDQVDYAQIPHFPTPSVVSHGAKLLLAELNGTKVIILTGRFHYYEGYSMLEVTFGIRVLKELGIRQLIMTNITGSVNTDLEVGELVLIKDHINLQSANPLRGVKDQRLGPRFTSMLNAYDPALRKLAKNLAVEFNIALHEGVYVAMDGPSLETPAEYRMIRHIGGDVVGMSTVPEVIIARQCNIQIMVLSIISNVWREGESEDHSIKEILENVQKGVPYLKALIKGILPQL